MEVSVVLPQNLPALETFQETAKETPKDAKFASTRNLQADENTSPLVPTKSLPHLGEYGKGKSQAVPQKKVIESVNLKDLLAQGEIHEETIRERMAGVPSDGFYERMKIGQQLKISATGAEFDYANYILRMRERIAQRWNPNSTVKAGMYKNREVRVEIVMVLDSDGQILDLVRTSTSLFEEFDNEAVRAIRESGPFLNPPQRLIQDDDKVYIPWSFTLYMQSFGIYRVE